MKKYKVGFYGGKFMPFHKGHLYCLAKAAEECETVYLLLMTGGNQEKEILKNNKELYLTPEERKKQIYRASVKLRSEAHIVPVMIDISKCVFEDGSEDWDAETPLVRAVCGDRIDAVYGSEPSYAEYFSRAYPEATYVLVDPDRKAINISGTECRKMIKENREQWII